MARFASRDAEWAALAGTMALGLAEHTEDFCDWPVSVKGPAAEAYEEKATVKLGT